MSLTLSKLDIEVSYFTYVLISPILLCLCGPCCLKNDARLAVANPTGRCRLFQTLTNWFSISMLMIFHPKFVYFNHPIQDSIILVNDSDVSHSVGSPPDLSAIKPYHFDDKSEWIHLVIVKMLTCKGCNLNFSHMIFWIVCRIAAFSRVSCGMDSTTQPTRWLSRS